jgi:hypothetical protein
VQIKNNITFTQRLLGAVDLAIDFATLGEYGLEELPATGVDAASHDGPCRERPGHRAGWEAPAAGRRGGCRRITGGDRCLPATYAGRR